MKRPTRYALRLAAALLASAAFGALNPDVEPAECASEQIEVCGGVTPPSATGVTAVATCEAFGDLATLTTFRDASAPLSPELGDTTRWLRDAATGLVTNKLYADGLGPSYTYTPDGKLATRTWARGVTTYYSYDANGSLTNVVYSDETPSIAYAYDTRGNIVSATIDGVSTNLYAYDVFGNLKKKVRILHYPGSAGLDTAILMPGFQLSVSGHTGIQKTSSSWLELKMNFSLIGKRISTE